MSNKFIQMTSGWIPVSVLLLFAAALVTGQARANLPAEIKSTPAHFATISIEHVVNSKLIDRLEVLPGALESVITLPSEIELTIDTKIFSSDGKDSASVRRLRK